MLYQESLFEVEIRPLPKKSISLFIDGGCNNSEKNISMRKMVSVVSLENGKIVSDKKNIGGSNNIAELMAVRDAMKYALEKGYDGIEIITDSRNNIAWTLGRRVGENINDREKVFALKGEIDELRKSLAIKMTWVPRSQNLAGIYLENKKN